MVITIDSGTLALIYELALITAIFGLDWIGSARMDPCPTLAQIDAYLELDKLTHNNT